MPAVTRRQIQFVAMPLLLTCGLVMTAKIDPGAVLWSPEIERRSVHDDPWFVAEHGRGRLRLQSTTASAEHESALRQVIVDQFANFEVETNFRLGVMLSEHWSSTSTRLLHLLAASESASAEIRDELITIRAVTTDAGAFAARLELLRNGINEETRIDEEVFVLSSALTMEQQCRKVFAALAATPVSFRESEAEIRTESYAVLDKVISYAYDCRGSAIAIIGHTDASGDESWNLHLSQARAQAVAEYLMRGGIDADRLRIEGHGSRAPIADNATAQGRSSNRRIEFILR